MPEVTHATTLIPVPAGAVIAVIADFDAYPCWAREVQSARVLSHEGDGWADRVRFEMDAGVLRDTYVLDYAWDIGRDGCGVVSWDIVESQAVRDLTGSYAVSRDDSGTKVTYRLTVTPQVPMLGALRRKAEQMIISTALTALRDRAIDTHTTDQAGGHA